AEDGIRDDLVTGVQTCALPICGRAEDRGRREQIRRRAGPAAGRGLAVLRRDAARVPRAVQHRGTVRESGMPGVAEYGPAVGVLQIGRASCRESVEVWVVGGALK